MNRMHPGKPPSQRTGPPEDWRSKIRKATSLVMTGYQHSPNPRGETIRDRVIRAAREALGQSSGSSMKAEFDGETIVRASGIFRMAIEGLRLDRRDPIAAESIMAEVQHVLDSEVITYYPGQIIAAYAECRGEVDGEVAVIAINPESARGRKIAEDMLGQGKINRDDGCAVFALALDDAVKVMEEKLPEIVESYRANPVPPDHFLVITVEREGSTLGCMPKPPV